MAESQHSVIFVNRHRAALIQRVSQVKPLADALLSQGLIQEETYTNICAAATRQDRMRELYAALHCTGDRAKAAFYTILKDAEPYLVEDLGPLETEIRGDPQSSGSVSDCCGEEELGKKYQEWVRCEYSTVQEYNHLPGEDVQLENRYTKLLIIQKHRQQKEREEELRCRGDSFQEVMNKRNCDEFMSTSVENLFDPDENGAVRRTVILQGQAGIGKSFTAQKIMFDWASGKLYSEIFLYIFHIKCRQLNLIGENISVVNLILNNSQHLAPVVTEILCSSEKILFIIDGFDELKYSLDVSHSLSHDLHEQNSPAITLSRLMRKVILPECFLLITTRSTALDKLTRVLKQPRYTEILGFSEEGMKTYFQNFFQDKKQAVDAFNYVKRNQIMFTTCFIPVICWIVCTVLRQQLEEGTNINHALSTTTTIFVYFVDTLLEHHCKSLRLPVQDVLRRLGALAESGIREQRVLFDDKHIQDIFPDPSQVPSSFLNKILLRKRIFKQAVYSFMHLSFQEFFTAFSYVLCDDKEAEEKVAELLAESKEKNKRHILMTIRFLFGLSNSETADLLKEKYNHSISPAIRFLLEGWIKEVIKMNNFIFGDNGLINILHFLYEIHEKDFVTLAMDNFKELDLSFQPLKRTDCAVVTYCLQACRRFERLNLRSCNLKSEELEMLLPVLPKCQSLDLQHNHLGDKGLTMLSKALQSPGCKIKELWVGVHRLSDEKMETLFSALSTVQTLAEVQLALDSLTERGAASLIHLIQNCGQLQVLRITVKGRDDSYMSATLSTPGRLKEDVLLGCEDVNVSEIILLCGGLRDSGVIIKDLELECHNVNVYEKILLCGELRERGVIVKDLQWSLTGLTDTCLDDLCSASSIQQTVTRLQLGHNELTDASIPVLNCFIQKCNNLHHFQVVVCRLPDEKLEDLCFALSTLQALSKAELTLNNLTERCATSLMHLIQSCGRLQKLRVSCGLLLEPGIRVLRESQRRPDCSLIIDGWRCNKPSDQCLDLELCNQTCNSHVCLKILGTSFIEEPYGGGKGCRKQRYLYTSEPAAE